MGSPLQTSRIGISTKRSVFSSDEEEPTYVRPGMVYTHSDTAQPATSGGSSLIRHRRTRDQESQVETWYFDTLQPSEQATESDCDGFITVSEGEDQASE